MLAGSVPLPPRRSANSHPASCRARSATCPHPCTCVEHGPVGELDAVEVPGPIGPRMPRRIRMIVPRGAMFQVEQSFVGEQRADMLPRLAPLHGDVEMREHGEIVSIAHPTHAVHRRNSAAPAGRGSAILRRVALQWHACADEVETLCCTRLSTRMPAAAPHVPVAGSPSGKTSHGARRPVFSARRGID